MKAEVTVQIDVEELMDAVFNDIYSNTSPWIVEYTYDWEDSNRATTSVPIKYYDPDTDEVASKEISPSDVVKAFQSCIGKRIWAQYVTTDFEWDALVSDYLVQIALFGKEIYA